MYLENAKSNKLLNFSPGASSSSSNRSIVVKPGFHDYDQLLTSLYELTESDLDVSDSFEGNLSDCHSKKSTVIVMSRNRAFGTPDPQLATFNGKLPKEIIKEAPVNEAVGPTMATEADTLELSDRVDAYLAPVFSG
jgi:hypothetical protein